MYIALVRVYVKPDRVEDFKALIRANHEGSISEPGCLRFDVAQSRDDPTALRALGVLPGRSGGGRHHKTTPHYLAFKAAGRDMMADERVSELYTGLYPETTAVRLMRRAHCRPSASGVCRASRSVRARSRRAARASWPATARRALLVSGRALVRQTSPWRAELEEGLAEAGVALVARVAVAGEPGMADVEAPVERYR